MSDESNNSSDDLDWEEWDPSRISFVHHMIAGSVAGLSEHVTIFPIDTIKTNIQCEKCGSMSPFQTWNCAERIVRKDGPLRLWRGVSTMFAGCVPAHAVYFSVFEFIKGFVGADRDGHHPIGAAFSGASAAFGHDLIMTPFDTVKQRMQLGHYRSIGHGFRAIVNAEGLGALYVSLPTTLLMNLPYGCIMVAVNESARKVLNPSGDYKTSTNLVAGAIAGASAAVLTNPLDLIKTKLQTQNLEPSHIAEQSTCHQSNQSVAPVLNNRSFTTLTAATKPSMEVPFSTTNTRYTGAFQVAMNIYKESGLIGFSSGMFPRVLVHTPSVAISWTAYEFTKNLLKKME